MAELTQAHIDALERFATAAVEDLNVAVSEAANEEGLTVIFVMYQLKWKGTDHEQTLFVRRSASGAQVAQIVDAGDAKIVDVKTGNAAGKIIEQLH